MYVIMSEVKFRFFCLDLYFLRFATYICFSFPFSLFVSSFFPPPLGGTKYREVKGQLRRMQAALKQAKRKDFYKVRLPTHTNYCKYHEGFRSTFSFFLFLPSFSFFAINE